MRIKKVFTDFVQSNHWEHVPRNNHCSGRSLSKDGHPNQHNKHQGSHWPALGNLIQDE